MKSVHYIALLFVVMLFTNEGCEEQRPVQPRADQIEQARTEQAMQEADRQTGHPAITRFQERKLLKMVYEARDDEKLVCHAYFFNELKGEIGQYLGPCLGFGIPYSTQFSNPQKVLIEENGYEAGDIPYLVPQAEPNGLFIPEGLSATWLFMLDDKGKPHPVYVEPAIIVSPFKLK